MKLVIKKVYTHAGVTNRRRTSHFEVDSPDLPGMPPVGRGQSIMGALGAWLHHNRDLVGVTIDVDPSAASTEQQRRSRELGKR